MLPPLGFAAMLPVARRRCIHLIAELGLTSNHSAASRRDAPDSTASTTRSRNSKEHGFGIDALQNSNQCHEIRLSKSSGESRFNPAEIRSNCGVRLVYAGPFRSYGQLLCSMLAAPRGLCSHRSQSVVGD